MKPDPKVLIIDPDRAARRLLRTVLEPDGYRVFEADTGEAALKQAVEHKPDVITLDLGLPDWDGLDFLQALREWNLTPVLVLSERTEDQVKVSALDAGASDFLTKPFSGTELLARLRVVQRPVPNAPDGPLLIDGELIVNVSTHEVTINGRLVKLTRKEEALFFVLARYAGKVVTCTHLMRSVWGRQSEDKLQDLRVLVGHLRRKLRPYGKEFLIRTVGNVGYSLPTAADSQPVSRRPQTVRAF